MPVRHLSPLSLLLAGLSLARAADADEPVVVTVKGDGRPEGELAAEPFVATSRVRRERLAAPALRAPEVLRGEAGVQIAEAGGLGAPATASIRGATSAQTPVYLGGVRLNDNVGGVADLSTIPLWLVDHVDVYRGNAPFAADEQGIGGAIYFEPRRPRRPEGSVAITAGSFGTRSGFGYLALGDDRAGVLVGVSSERAENDYEFVDDRGTLFEGGDDAVGRRINSDSRLHDAWLLARVKPGPRSRMELLANLVEREQGAPKLALVPSRRARAELSRGLLALTTRLGLDEAGQHTLTLRSTVLDATSALHDPARELGALGVETEVHGRRLEQQARLELGLGSRVGLGLSFVGGAEELDRSDSGSESSASASTLGGAAQLTFRALPTLSLRALVAARCRTTQPGAEGCRDFEPTGRAGAGLSLRGATLFVNFSQYQREPALGELYGAGVLVRGNSQLRSELGLAVDAGARAEHAFERARIWASTGGFVRSAERLVAYVRTAQGYVVPLNVEAARIAGLEATVGGEAFEHLRLDCSVTLLDPRDTTAGRRLANDVLPFMSRLVLAPRLGLSTGELSGPALRHAELAFDASYLSNRFADAAGLIVIPEQTTLGMTAVASWLSGVLVTRARLGNLLNTARFDIVGYPLPGRSLYVSAEVHAE